MENSEIFDLIKITIQKADLNPQVSVVTSLEEQSVNSTEFWLSAAEELIRLNYKYEALGCFKNARKFQGSSDRIDLEEWASYFYESGIPEEAESIYKELRYWDELATIQLAENKPRAEVLNSIELALENNLSFGIDSYVMRNIKKLATNFPGDELNNLFSLGQLYLFEADYPKALELWAKALKKEPEKFADILNEAIYCLNWHSLDYRDVPKDKIYPS